jgi:hypothetical protein
MHVTLRIGALPVSPIPRIQEERLPGSQIRMVRKQPEHLLDQVINPRAGFIAASTIVLNNPSADELVFVRP